MPNYGRKKRVKRRRKRVVKRKRVVRTIGNKASVYKGFAKRTSGGLTKKDIVRTKRKGVVSYKSKRKVKVSKTKKSGGGLKKWREALKKARKELIKSGKIKDPKSFKSFAPKKGTPLYKRAKEIYTS
tara:strand:- start:2272 stop:2652 length:381 start_codon:yes stop_codon:yes gene_type:complete